MYLERFIIRFSQLSQFIIHMQKQIKKLKQAGKTIEGVKFQGSTLFELQFEKETQEPYCNIVLLIIHAKQLNGKPITFQRTGTLIRIDKYWYVLTAARNVYNQAISNYHESMELYFIKKQKRNEGRFFFIQIQINDKTCLFDQNYITQKGPQIQNKIFEIAFIDIHDQIQQIQDKPNGLKISFGYDKIKQKQKLNLLMSGYSFQNVDVKVQTQHQSYFQQAHDFIKEQKNFKDNILAYKFSALKGHCGSPILIKDQQRWKIIGIHIGALQNQISCKTPEYNFAITFNEQSNLMKIKMAEQWRKKNQWDKMTTYHGAQCKNSFLREIPNWLIQNYPHNKFVCLQIIIEQSNNNKKLNGSGTLIKYKNNLFILTAAHNLYDTKLKKLYFKINCLFQSKFYLKKKTKMTIQLNTQNCKINKKYLSQQTKKKQAYQIALIDINAEVQSNNLLQKLPKGQLNIEYYWKQNPYQNIQNTKIQIGGYCCLGNDNSQIRLYQSCGTLMKKKQIQQIFNQNNTDKLIKSKQLLYKLSTKPGQSGSAILAIIEGQYKIVGIHVGAGMEKPQKKPDDEVYFNIGISFSGEQYFEKLVSSNQNSLQESINNNQIEDIQGFYVSIKKQFQIKKQIQIISLKTYVLKQSLGISKRLIKKRLKELKQKKKKASEKE